MCSADNHVPKIERYIRTIKDRARSAYRMLPFLRIPRVMIIHLVKNAVFWLNAFPANGSVLSKYSLRYIMTGQELDYNKHARLEFGKYMQMHEEHDSSMKDCTIRAICLGLPAILRDVTGS